MTRAILFGRGQDLMERWCLLNGVATPKVVTTDEPKFYGVCAFYRSGVTYIAVDACAPIGRAARAWSWPGYVVDRTPYGVLAHELGHHVDGAHGAQVHAGMRSFQWRRETGELPITTYCPNDNEWFAEMFRLFVTNPTLLQAIRPKTFERMIEDWPHRAEDRDWRDVLAGADRQIRAAENKIREAEKSRQKSLRRSVQPMLGEVRP